MKYNILFALLFLSVLVFANVEFRSGVVGATRLNGNGCICHRSSFDDNISVWIDGPNTIIAGETEVYKIYLTGGPAAAGGFNTAARFGTLTVIDPNTTKFDLELTHNKSLAFTNDTVSWSFQYTAPDTVLWDTLYSVAQSVNLNGFPDTLDRWNFSPNFVVKIDPVIPVELTIFTIEVKNENALLVWQTAAEINNLGFEIQRTTPQSAAWLAGEERNEELVWQTIGFVKGNGTTASINQYFYTDKNLIPGFYKFRLKQINYDGSFSYSEILDAVIAPSNFSLEQNYPNPFNPSTSIKFSLPADSKIVVKLFNITGEEIMVIAEGEFKSGSHILNLNGEKLSSGIYIYSITAENVNGIFSASKKLTMIK